MLKWLINMMVIFWNIITQHNYLTIIIENISNVCSNAAKRNISNNNIAIAIVIFLDYEMNFTATTFQKKPHQPM